MSSCQYASLTSYGCGAAAELQNLFFNLMLQLVLEIGRLSSHSSAAKKESTNLRSPTLSFRMHLHRFKAQSNGNSAKTCEMPRASIFERGDLHFMFCRIGLPSCHLESNISYHQLYVTTTQSFGRNIHLDKPHISGIAMSTR